MAAPTRLLPKKRHEKQKHAYKIEQPSMAGLSAVTVFTHRLQYAATVRPGNAVSL